MNIVFDVVVDGKKRETLRPNKHKLSDIRDFMKIEAAKLMIKYGNNVYIHRRFEY